MPSTPKDALRPDEMCDQAPGAQVRRAGQVRLDGSGKRWLTISSPSARLMKAMGELVKNSPLWAEYQRKRIRERHRPGGDARRTGALRPEGQIGGYMRGRARVIRLPRGDGGG
jgi:hypothetical protein